MGGDAGKGGAHRQGLAPSHLAPLARKSRPPSQPRAAPTSRLCALFCTLQQVQLAHQIYDYVDRHIQKLDKELKAFDAEVICLVIIHAFDAEVGACWPPLAGLLLPAVSCPPLYAPSAILCTPPALIQAGFWARRGGVVRRVQ